MNTIRDQERGLNMPWSPRGAPRKAEQAKPREPILTRLVERIFLSCPVCGMSRIFNKSGRWAKLRNKEIDIVKGRVHYGNFDLDDSFLIQRRDCSGSRGHGFPVIGGYTLEQLKDMPEYQQLVAELKQTCEAILNKLS